MQVHTWPDTAQWAPVVQASPEATFFHAPVWHEIIAAVYKGHATATLQFSFEDGTLAVLPCIQTRRGGLLRGKPRLKSSVFGTYGGLVSNRPLSHDQETEVYRHLKGLKAHLSIQTNPFSSCTLPACFACKETFTQVFALQPGQPPAQRLSRGARSNLNQARKKGVSVRIARTDQELSAYYTIYQDTLKRWGTQALSTYPEELFFEISRRAADAAQLWIAEVEGRIIAGALVFYWNTIAVYWHGASLQDYFACYPNNLLHIAVVEDAAARGYRFYDFGASGGQQGVVRFKESFGAEQRPFFAGRLK
jgi:lipid II:glycine glycyltransferase (peptidoglycan interpeptide bridge formation enzyme)